ncbi:hypothetical protein GCM10009799_50040 [Nocardiopsis rhodophaea]|uniref:Uncharacterized protein n=1 Tax=Nocardiopsis rhodophaea TaxID=280238 RepID=A0ABN2TP17_9ACTN
MRGPRSPSHRWPDAVRWTPHLDEIGRCLDRGYTSVMIDGSHMSFAENARLTARAVSAAQRYGA